MIVELAIDAADIQFGAVPGTQIEAQRCAEAFALDIVIAILDFQRKDRAAGLGPIVRLDIVGFESPPVIADTARHTGIRAQPRGEVETGLRADLVGVAVVAAFDFGREQAFLAVEGTGRLDLDRGTDRVGVHIGRERLLHLDRFDDVGRDHVESDGANIAFGRWKPYPVERRRDKIRRQTANRNEAPLALIVQHVDAGQAAQAFGHILIGKLADRVARQHIGDTVGFLLAGKRAGQVGGLTDDQDFIVAKARQGDIRAYDTGGRHVDRPRHRARADIAYF